MMHVPETERAVHAGPGMGYDDWSTRQTMAAAMQCECIFDDTGGGQGKLSSSGPGFVARQKFRNSVQQG